MENKAYWKTIKIAEKNQKYQKDLLNIITNHHLDCGLEIHSWECVSQEIEEKIGLKVNFSIFGDAMDQLLIQDSEYVEEINLQRIYLAELPTFRNVKTSYELGLVSKEDYIECADYVKSLKLRASTQGARPKIMDEYQEV